MKKKIIIIATLIIAAFALITLYFREQTRQLNIKNKIEVQKPYPNPLYATATCINFKRNLFKTKADIIISNPSSINYKVINVAVVGIGKDDENVEIQNIVFENILGNHEYSKTLEFSRKVLRIECPITKFE